MRKAIVLPLALIALTAIAAVTILGAPPSGTPRLASGVTLQPRTALPDFQLRDHSGKTFTRASLAGRWHLVFPGFTHCPDICPTTLATLNQVHQQLGQQSARLGVVLLTVDPARDTPAVLSRYLAHFSTDFIGITGDGAQLETLYTGLGVQHIRIPGANGEYSVDHSAALLLLDPETHLAGYFRPPFNVQALVEDLQRVL